LTNEWWTKVCNSSLDRIGFKEDGDQLVADTDISRDTDEESNLVARMKKKLARASFREFSKVQNHISLKYILSD